MTSSVTRRDFLKVSAVAGGGMLIGFRLAGAQAAPGPFKANAWISIAPDGAVTLTCGRNEI